MPMLRTRENLWTRRAASRARPQDNGMDIAQTQAARRPRCVAQYIRVAGHPGTKLGDAYRLAFASEDLLWQ